MLLAPQCLATDHRACLMREAKKAAGSDCDRAFRLAMVCQCHNAGAMDGLRSAGADAVCKFITSSL